MKDCKFSPDISMMDMQTRGMVPTDYSGYHNYRADLAPKSYREIAEQKKSYNAYLKQLLNPPSLLAEGRRRDSQYNS